MNKKLYNFILVCILSIAFQSCSNSVDSEPYLEQLLDKKEILFEEISVQYGTAVWNLYSDEAEADQLTPRKRFQKLFSNDTINTLIDRWYSKRNNISNRELRRRVGLWYNILIAAKVNFDEEIFQLQNELEIWLTEEDSLPNMPSKEELEIMTTQLIHLRNEKARLLGYSDYPEMVLDVTELGSDWFFDFLSIIDSVTLSPYKKLVAKTLEIKEEIEYSDVRQWIMDYYIFSFGPEIEPEKKLIHLKETLGNIGINYDQLPVKILVRDLPPMVGGQGIAVRIPDDFRIAVRPDLDFSGWMHEMGHGLQWIFTKTNAAILKGYEWCMGNDCGAFSEGLAETSARMINNQKWLQRYSDYSEREYIESLEKMKVAFPAYLRKQLMDITEEIEFYRNPERDFHDLRNELAKKYYLVDKPLTRRRSVANMLYVSYPVYVQSYLIADVISWQIHSTLEEKFGKDYIFEPEVGKFLKENLYAHGELYSWQTRLKLATGKELDVEGFLKAFGL